MARRRPLDEKMVDEEIDQRLLKRAEARRNDPRWRIVPDCLTAEAGGGRWQYNEEEG